MNQKDIDRFWSKVDKTGDCWLWLGTVSRGHCVISIGKAVQYAVRIAWELERGAPPARIDLRRTCDSPLCIRPDHRTPRIKKTPQTATTPRIRAFADMPESAATYYILNLVNHRIYVGMTETLRVRLRTHLSSLNSNRHQSSALQSDWNTYGRASFEFGMLVKGIYPGGSVIRPAGNSESFEDMFVRAYQSDNPKYGYNIGHFQRQSNPAVADTARIEKLAKHWNIGGRRYASEVVRRCIDYTYQQLFPESE